MNNDNNTWRVLRRDEDTPSLGGGRCGTIVVAPAALVAALGPETFGIDDSGDQKVTREWYLADECGNVFAVYDYTMCGPSYGPPSVEEFWESTGPVALSIGWRSGRGAPFERFAEWLTATIPSAQVPRYPL